MKHASSAKLSSTVREPAAFLATQDLSVKSVSCRVQRSSAAARVSLMYIPVKQPTRCAPPAQPKLMMGSRDRPTMAPRCTAHSRLRNHDCAPNPPKNPSPAFIIKARLHISPPQDSATASTRAHLLSVSNYHDLPGTIRPQSRSAPFPLSSSARHQFTPECQGRGWPLERKHNRVEASHRLKTVNRRLAIARGSILAFVFSSPNKAILDRASIRES